MLRNFRHVSTFVNSIQVASYFGYVLHVNYLNIPLYIGVKSSAEDSLKCTSFSFAGVLQPHHLIIITSHQILNFVGHLSCFFRFGGALWMDVPRLFIAIVFVVSK